MSEEAPTLSEERDASDDATYLRIQAEAAESDVVTRRYQSIADRIDRMRAQLFEDHVRRRCMHELVRADPSEPTVQKRFFVSCGLCSASETSDWEEGVGLCDQPLPFFHEEDCLLHGYDPS